MSPRNTVSLTIWFAANIPSDSCGGIARSMVELSQGLKIRGHKTILVTAKKQGETHFLLFAATLLVRYLLAVFSRPDCIIARSTDGVLCAVVIKLFKMKTRILLHNHGWEEYSYALEKRLPQAVITHPTTWKALATRFPLLRLTLRLCDRCISGTEYEVNALKKKYPSLADKHCYIPNGVHCRVDHHWLRQQSFPHHFLSVANTGWKKNITYTLQLFTLVRESIPAARLFCIGTGVDDTDFSAITGTTSEGVTNIPSVAFHDMERWYKTCPYMIVSSRYEGGHSLALLEALSFGCVVFASPIPSNKEIIVDNVNGFLISGSYCQNDAGILAHAITPGSLHDIRSQAVQTAARNEWRDQITRLETILCKQP